MSNTPKYKKSPIDSKNPRVLKLPENINDMHPAWRLSIMDHRGFVGWDNITTDIFLSKVLPKIKNFETMTWISIKQNGSHPVAINHLCKKARDRLQEIKLEDLDDLFSLRLEGELRIWGILEMNILKILWYDPEHLVCPSTLKHT